MDALERKHAIDFTQMQIKRYIRNGFLEANPVWLKYWCEFGFGLATEETPYLTMRKKSVKKLCTAARENQEAFRLLKRFAGERMQYGKKIPRKVSMVLADYLLKDIEPQGLGSGRPAKWGRDFIVILSMRELLQTYDLNATRRKELSTNQTWINRRGEPASELVRLAIGGTNIGHMELNRIQRIWDNKEKQLELDIFWEHFVTDEFDEAPEVCRI